MASRGNPNIGPIPLPSQVPESVLNTVISLKEAVESLAGQRGVSTNRAVTFNDLVQLGLVTATVARQLADK